MWSRSDWELCAFSEAQKLSPTGVGRLHQGQERRIGISGSIVTEYILFKGQWNLVVIGTRGVVGSNVIP